MRMKWSTEQAMDMLGVNDSDRGILQKKLCIFTKVYFSNTLYLTSKIVYTMPEMNKIIV